VFSPAQSRALRWTFLVDDIRPAVLAKPADAEGRRLDDGPARDIHAVLNTAHTPKSYVALLHDI